MHLYIIVGLVFMSTFLLVFSALYMISKRRDPVKARLQELATKAGTDSEVEYDFSASLLRKGVDLFAADVQHVTTREWLIRAGYFNEGAIYNYYLIKIILAVILASAAGFISYYFHWSSTQIVFVVVGAIILGIFIPRLWISRKITNRRDAIRRAVPNMLDLLVVCVEAGLSFTAALHRLSEEMRASCVPLAQELTIVTQEILVGKPKAEAFRSLANRTEVDELRSLAVTLIQADRLGTSIAASLRVLANTMRFNRRQRAEEAANKISVKLVFPLVLLIFPELLIILVGPAFISIFRTLSTVTGQ
jgi:tight adherence protein C